MTVRPASAAAGVWLVAVFAVCILRARGCAGFTGSAGGEPLTRPTMHPPMGTDNLGRDEWSRMLFGGRVSLAASLSAAALAVILGTAAALVAQGIGGRGRCHRRRRSERGAGDPGPAHFAGGRRRASGRGSRPSSWPSGSGLTPGFARLARQALAQVRSEPYIAAAGALGADGMDTARRHMLPNALPRLLSLATTHYAWAFAGITTLSFLGLSGSASRPEWGTMLNAARPYLRDAAWLAFFPGGAIVATILSVHTLGAWLARRVTPAGRRSGQCPVACGQ